MCDLKDGQEGWSHVSSDAVIYTSLVRPLPDVMMMMVPMQKLLHNDPIIMCSLNLNYHIALCVQNCNSVHRFLNIYTNLQMCTQNG